MVAAESGHDVVSRLLPWLRRSAARVVRSSIVRLRVRGRPAMAKTIRLTGAAVASYVVAEVLLPDTIPVLAALTALLVVEATLFDIVILGVQRVVSVVAGVVLAVGFSAVVHISWWSLGLLVAASIGIGQLLRLGPHLLEVPISAMLVLAVGGAESAASDRITETLIGAVVGVAVNLVFPPSIRSDNAAAAVERFADEIAVLLRRAADEMVAGISAEEAARWLEGARRLTRHVARIDRTLLQAEQSRRLNPRALAQRDTRESLRGGLEALEHSSVAIRTMFWSILDGVRDHPGSESADASEIRSVFAVVLRELAAAVRAFGFLVKAEVDETTEEAEARAAAALESLREARALVTELQLVDARADLVAWELNDAILEAVERVLGELDIQAQARRRNNRRALHLPDPLAVVRDAQDRLRATTRHLADQTLFRHPDDLFRPPPKRP